MAFNPFIGQSQSQLEFWLREAQTDYAAGRTSSSATAGDVGGTSLVQMTPFERITKLLEALHRIDPVAYPTTAGITRTQQFVAAGYW